MNGFHTVDNINSLLMRKYSFQFFFYFFFHSICFPFGYELLCAECLQLNGLTCVHPPRSQSSRPHELVWFDLSLNIDAVIFIIDIIIMSVTLLTAIWKNRVFPKINTVNRNSVALVWLHTPSLRYWVNDYWKNWKRFILRVLYDTSAFTLDLVLILLPSKALPGYSIFQVAFKMEAYECVYK